MNPVDLLTSNRPDDPSISLRIDGEGEGDGSLSVQLEGTMTTDKSLVTLSLGMDAVDFSVTHLPVAEIERLGEFLLSVSARWK